MITYKYEFDKKDLENLKKAMTDTISKEKYSTQVMDMTIVSFHRDVVGKTPGKTGNTRRNWYWAKVAESGRRLFNKLSIAVFLEDGTLPHDIYPKNKKTLAWPGKSKYSVETTRTTNKLTGKALKHAKIENVTFAMHVHHPGTKAVDMVKSSIPDALMTWSVLVKKFVEDVWKK